MSNESDPFIYVTKPFLPDFIEFIDLASSIWDSSILTNNGPLHNELENKLAEYLDVPYVSLFCNGSAALYQAIFSLALPQGSEVITTPFSFIASSNAILQNGLNPIFCDIEPGTFNIDASKIQSLITPQTRAILAVHCYGLPCDVDSIESIAHSHNLQVIYDAAHAFAVKCHCGSILNHGRFSVLSFHATKVFNTFEGGAVISQTLEDKKRIDSTRNFGFCSEFDVDSFGTNAKLSEIHCALGLLQLNYIDAVIADRKRVSDYYQIHLSEIVGLKLPYLTNLPLFHNYSYYPILVTQQSLISRDDLYGLLKKENIYSRKYFYPLIPDFSMYKRLFPDSSCQSDLSNARVISNNVLCLPIYPGLTENLQHFIVSVILRSLSS